MNSSDSTIKLQAYVGNIRQSFFRNEQRDFFRQTAAIILPDALAKSSNRSDFHTPLAATRFGPTLFINWAYLFIFEGRPILQIGSTHFFSWVYLIF